MSFAIADDLIHQMQTLAVLLDQQVYRLLRENDLLPENVLIGIVARNAGFIHGAVHMPFAIFGNESTDINGRAFVDMIAKVIESNTLFALENCIFEITIIKIPPTKAGG